MEVHNCSSVVLVASCILLILGDNQINCIPIEEFFQFGPGAPGSTSFPRGDDEETQLNLAVDFLYFNKTYTTINIFTNGILSFGTDTSSSYTPVQFPLDDGIPSVAPFWADVDTRRTGSIWYRLTDETDSAAADKIESIVTAAAFNNLQNFVATQLLIVTWDEVGYYRQNTDKINTFQCVLASDGSTTIVIFLYADDGINWTTGDASGGSSGFSVELDGRPAQAGFDAGDGVNFLVIEGSFTNDIVNIEEQSNVGIAGLFVFQVDQAEIQAPESKCPVIGSGPCKERLIQLACIHINGSQTNPDAVPALCRERL